MTKLDRFVHDREATWSALSQLLAQHEKRRDRLSEDELRWLARAYRTTAADLATARRFFPGHPMVGRVDGLVRQSYAVINRDAAGLDSSSDVGIGGWVGFREFASRRYWQLIASRPMLVGLSALFLFMPMLLVILWAQSDPAKVSGFIPAGFRDGSDTLADAGYSAGQQSVFATELFTNNIRVSFLVFAAGITAGLGTGYLLIVNGILIGSVLGMAVSYGNGSNIAALILPHGVLELSIIVVCSAAGLRIGWALVDPGTESRSTALIREARAAIMIVAGTIPWFVVAGLIEAFFTPSGFGLAPGAVLGVGVGGLYWGLVFFRGRKPIGPVPKTKVSSDT